MKYILLDNFKFEIDKSQVFARLRVSEDGEDAERINELIGEAYAIGKPKCLLKLSYIDSKGDNTVEIDGTEFKSRVMRVNFDEIHRVFPYVVTSGMELEEWANSISDYLERYWTEVIRESVLAYSMNLMKNHIREEYGIKSLSNMNPGSLQDWPINEQRPLFDLLGDVEGLTGVKLTDSFLMIPAKSVSGIAFPTETSFESCQLCPRENCIGRRAPYDKSLLAGKYK